MEENHQKLLLSILVILLSVVFINLMLLDVAVFKDADKTSIIRQIAKAPSKTISTPTILPKPTIHSTQSCPSSCMSAIKEATKTAQQTSLSVSRTPSSKSSSGVREFFIPIGSGSTSSGNWEDIGGLQVYVDSTKYNDIKSVVFEASVRVPTKNQWVDVRLYNTTDKHPVWYSEVRFPGGSDAKLVTSQPITLDSGNKLYKLQMKTQLKHPAFLDQSRIHITTN